MEAATAGTNRLHIGCFRPEYLIPAGHPDPHRLKRRLDETFERLLPEVLQATLRSWVSDSDESIWLIRRLDVPLVVSSAWSGERSARRFAEEVSRAIAQSVAAGGEDVIQFPNRAAYLARFLSDLAAGQAWGKWYYEAFRGLRVLPLSSALRSAICDAPLAGLNALLLLPERSAARVLESLTASDARQVLEHLPGNGGTDAPTFAFDRLWEAWLSRGIELSSIDQEPTEALGLYLEVCRRQPVAGATVKAMAKAMVRMARLLDGSVTSESLLDALTKCDGAALYAVDRGSDILSPLLHVKPGHVLAVARRLQNHRPHHGTPAAQRFTAFGGIFLLLPILDEIPLDAATADWPDLNQTSPTDVVRFLILLKCFGRRRAARMFYDALVRDLMKITPAVTWPELRSWASRRTQLQLDKLLSSTATWQREQDAVQGDDLSLVRVPLPGAVAGLVVDGRRGVCLFATSDASGRRSRLSDSSSGRSQSIDASAARSRFVERTRSWLALAGFVPERVAVDPAFGEPVRSALDRRRETTLDQAIRRKTAADINELIQPTALRAARPADLALSVAAQQVLRAFAWRLPGFAASSPSYLAANLLDVPAVLVDEAERRLVRLEQPPLQYVLGLTGMARSTYLIRRLDHRPFVLFQERL